MQMSRNILKSFYPSLFFLKKDPLKSIVIIVAFLMSGFVEALSLASLLPLINVVLSGTIDTSSKIGEWVYNGLIFLGVPISTQSILLVIMFLMISKSLLLFWGMREVGYTAANMAASMRKDLLKGLIGARWQFYVNQKKGDVAAVISTEPDRSAAIFIITGRMFAAIIQIILYSLVSFSLSITVTLAAYFLGILIMFLLRSFVTMAEKAGSMQTRTQRKFLSNLVDGLIGLKPLKSMSRISQLDKYLTRDINSLCIAKKRATLSKVSLNNLQEPLQVIPIILGLYFLLNVMGDNLDILMVLIFLLYRTLQRVGALQKSYQDISAAIPAFWFIDEMLKKTRTHREKWDGELEPILEQGIKLNDVYFSYGEKQVLFGVNINIDKGDFISLVGNSGSGKSTIVDLIIGLNRSDEGEVMIDNQNINSINIEKWREKIGYVPQEITLFNDTIKHNITMGDESISDENIISSLMHAGANNFVSELPEKLMTVVGEHGGRLSGGQRQRLAIARALVKNPELLILDESTSALDSKTEKEIIKTLLKLKGKTTIIAISHQQNIQKVADKVYFLENGSVVS
jgi:ATP-binding cassette subfamily C protein